MPKRQNPFGEPTPMQLKQHIGRKEVDLGVGRERHMIGVYARTKELLFSGAKKSFEAPVDANCNNIYSESSEKTEDVAMEEETVDSQQLRLSTQGELITENNNIKVKNAFQQLFHGRKASATSGCHCCKGQAASQDRCGFCEKSICYDCVRSCVACEGNFCPLCSVLNPLDSSRRWYCQKCSCTLYPYIYWTSAS